MNKKNNGTKSTEKREYAPSVGFWPAKNGNGFTAFIKKEVIEQLAKAEEGGTLFLQEVDIDNPKAPAYRVTIFPPNNNSDSI